MYFPIIIALALVAFFVWLFIRRDRHHHHTAGGNTGQKPETTDSKVATHTQQGGQLSYVHEPASKKHGLVGALFSSKSEHTEDSVTRALSELGPHYIIFTNLIVSKNGYIKTTEVDHLVISAFGIFCIETKSHSGSIYGSAINKEWNQYLGEKTFHFYNPIFQNETHVKALSHLLSHKLKAKIHNYVVFPNTEKVRVNSGLVFESTDKLIQALNKHRRMVYGQEDLTEIAHILAKYTHRYEQLRDKHARNVHAYLTR